MDRPKMFRKRFIPDDIKSLNDDVILSISDELIVTKWNTFKPKKEFSKGISCTFLKEGYKISKFMNDNGELVYYYCDIISCDYKKEENTWIFTDLLTDVKIHPDNRVEVVDLGEAVQAYESGLINADDVIKMLARLDRLLDVIYSGKWKEMTELYFDQET